MSLRDILAVVSVVFAVGLATAGLILPPLGVIDTSLVWFFAQALLFAATMLGLDMKVIEKSATPKK